MKNLIVLAVLLSAGSVSANRHWVSPIGAATYAGAGGTTPLSGTSCCTIHSANGGCAAGDTIYLRAGTYLIGDIDGAAEGIQPHASGTGAAHMITYSAYPGEVVNLVGNSNNCYAAFIRDHSWIRITGFDGSTSARNLIFTRFYHHLQIVSADYTGYPGSNYCQVDHCTFSGMYDSSAIDYRGSTIEYNASYNWIHDCLFERYGNFFNVTQFTNNGEASVVFEIGYDDGTSGSTNYNVVENNTIQYGGHHTLGVHGIKNVIRGNYVQNAPWFDLFDTLRGERNLYTGGMPAISHSNLYEGNRTAYGGATPAPDHVSGEGGLFAEQFDILRYNEFVRTDLMAMFFHVHSSGWIVDNNCVYNNTVWHCGWQTGEEGKANWGNEWTHSVYIHEQGGVTNTHIKNNLFYQNKDAGDALEFTGGTGNGGSFVNQDIGPNWLGNTSGDPKFMSISAGPEPENPSQYNLSLQSTSGAIDKGASLTTAANSGGNSTLLTVAVPYYFQDGWGNGAGGGASVQADWIAVGTISNTAQIRSINYDTKTITLASPLSWSNGASVWLFKNSKGDVVLSGTAPDYGAHEYLQISAVHRYFQKDNGIKNMDNSNYRMYDLQGRLIVNGSTRLSCKPKTPGVFIIAYSGKMIKAKIVRESN